MPQFITIKDIEAMIGDSCKIVGVRQENKWIAVELSNNMRIKIRNF
jgi:hypothetical protein